MVARGLVRQIACFYDNRRGASAIVVALLAVPMVVGVGMGVDYILAQQRQEKLNAICDTAALAGETPAMMTQSWSAGQIAAIRMFAAQASAYTSVNNLNASVTGQDTATGTGTTRTITVSYTAQSPNIFSALLNIASLPIQGTSTATQSQAPNINYYLLLDTSPSMAIAATQAGIATMVANTSSQGGCAFGCHEINPSSDNLGNPGGEDNYALARALSVPLRIDLVNSATQSMLSLAPTIGAQNNATYKFGVYTFDYTIHQLATLGTASAAQTAANNLQQLEVYNNGGWLTQNTYNDDEDTNWDGAMSSLYSGTYQMPTPGLGSSAPGDTPQEVLFIVSDGVIDESSSGNRLISPVGEFSAWCTNIKARGIRIAFLYTTYYPLTTNGFYNSYVAPFEAQIGPTYAQGCASPGLYFEVSTGGDITSAMNTLFQKTVTTAHLTQ